MATTRTHWNFQLSEQDATNLYNIGCKLYGVASNIVRAVDVGLLAMNVYNWRQTGWNPKYIMPVVASGLICVKGTAVYKSGISKLTGWVSGYTAHRSIRNMIKSARNYAICQSVASTTVIYGLSWGFNRTEYIINFPGELLNICLNLTCVYGCSLMLRPQTQDRIIDFISELLAPATNNMTLGAGDRKPFDELVDTVAYTEPQSCPICMDDEKYELGIIKSCQHKFCRECLQEWYHKPVSCFNCPLCRISLDTPIDNMPAIRDTLTQLFNGVLTSPI